jgi:hypothetical protein
VTAPAKKSEESAAYDDEITIERRVKLPVAVTGYAASLTTRMPVIDERLLAIARGEIDPEDPFGGLIPIYDTEDAAEIDDSWLLPNDAAAADDSIFGHVVPRLRLPPQTLLSLPMSDACRFFVSQIDNKRSVGELIDACRMDDLEGLETIDELMRIGAIELS